MTSDSRGAEWVAQAPKVAAGIRLRGPRRTAFASKAVPGHFGAGQAGDRGAGVQRQSPSRVRPGGMMPEKIGEMKKFYGKDAALLMGGGLFTASPDLVENCRRFREKLAND